MIRRAALLAVVLTLSLAGTVAADGIGQIVAPTQSVGPFRVTVYGGALPYPTGAGSFSVLVQDHAGAPVIDQPIRLEAVSPSGATVIANASFALSTNRLLAVAVARLDEPGEWQFAVRVGEVAELARFTVPVRTASPIDVTPAIALVLAPSLLVLAGFALRRHKRSRGRRRATRPAA